MDDPRTLENRVTVVLLPRIMDAALEEFFGIKDPSEKKVRSLFGVQKKTIYILYWTIVLSKHYTEEYKLCAKHVLWTLFWLKNYPTWSVLATTVKADEKTASKFVWRTIAALWSVLDTVRRQYCVRKKFTGQIALEDRWKFGKLPVSLIVDTTECPVRRPADPVAQGVWYSGKHKEHTIKYEVGVSLVSGEICWWAGGVPGCSHDIKVNKTMGLLDHLNDDEYLLGDKGYSGPKYVTPIRGKAENLSEKQKAWNSFLGKSRVLVENVFARFKNFAVLRHKWRNNLALHPYVFSLLAQIVNVEIQFGSPMRL